VVGIVASRIKDRLHRPTIAFADSDADSLKGSARSIPGLHIRDALDRVATRNPGLVEKFGGHAMAAGLSLSRDRLPAFRDALEAVVSEMVDDVELDAVIESDGALDDADLGLALATQLRYAAPWGQHFPEPVFDGVFHVIQHRVVGDSHLKLVLSSDRAARTCFDAIQFNADLENWPADRVDRVKLAYRLDCNYYRGEERLQLMVEAIELVPAG
jgi:single-stranded-DNA-specific exonuclease